jgi:hypothetical protein
VGLAEVSNVLWRERELLEMLLFKLEEEQLVLAGGRTRWLAHATREVETVLAQIRDAELLRSVQVDEVAAELGLPPGASLRALAEHAPAPWDELLRGHREAFLTLTTEITSLAESNRDLLTSGHRAAHETLLGITGGLETYDPTGRTRSTTATHLVDEAL